MVHSLIFIVPFCSSTRFFSSRSSMSIPICLAMFFAMSIDFLLLISFSILMYSSLIVRGSVGSSMTSLNVSWLYIILHAPNSWLIVMMYVVSGLKPAVAFIMTLYPSLFLFVIILAYLSISSTRPSLNHSISRPRPFMVIGS